MSDYFVYVLRSAKNGRHYTGSTNDIHKRLAEHNSGQTKSTRHTGPYSLVYSESFASRPEAARRERALKSGKGREELSRILQQSEMR
jgi:putative endonuclease